MEKKVKKLRRGIVFYNFAIGFHCTMIGAFMLLIVLNLIDAFYTNVVSNVFWVLIGLSFIYQAHWSKRFVQEQLDQLTEDGQKHADIHG